jgi:hypothetical protein
MNVQPKLPKPEYDPRDRPARVVVAYASMRHLLEAPRHRPAAEPDAEEEPWLEFEAEPWHP